MAAAPRVLIAGGAGVFGRLLARELLTHSASTLLIAGRDLDRAADACRSLGAGARATPLRLDLREPKALGLAARGCFAVACAAGPFATLPRALPADAVAVGAHWLDIADDPDWVLPLLADRALDHAAAAAGVAVLTGLSTVPALSGLLVRDALAMLPDARRARITLFIGNRNAKGTAAIARVLRGGLRDLRPVSFPFGRYRAYRFRSPDAALLRAELGIEAETRVAFEWQAAGRALALGERLTRGLNPDQLLRIVGALALLAAPFGRFGTDRGCLQAELWDAGGAGARAALISRGQRLAALPCALALEALLADEISGGGVLHPATWLLPEQLMPRLQDRGVRCLRSAVA